MGLISCSLPIAIGLAIGCWQNRNLIVCSNLVVYKSLNVFTGDGYIRTGVGRAAWLWKATLANS
jgi:hypothetical protein